MLEALVVYIIAIRILIPRRSKSVLDIDFACQLFKLRVKRRIEQDG